MKPRPQTAWVLVYARSGRIALPELYESKARCQWYAGFFQRPNSLKPVKMILTPAKPAKKGKKSVSR